MEEINHLKEFSDRLKELLILNNDTVKTISEKSGIKCSVFYEYLNGKRVPYLANAVKICDCYECSLDYLFGFEDNYKKAKRTTVSPVCERLKYAIDNSGKSRYLLSKETKFDHSDIWQWYHGKRTPSLITLVTFAKVLGCSLDFLAGREE